jgi:hypothetical protein
MDKKYQVFVSSTYEDLKEERQEVMQAVLELDCIPSGMELFPAADEEQWSLIKKVIDDCDYYIVIIGGRYGSIDKTSGKSFTQLEYEYALSKNKPVIAFPHKNPGKIIAEKTENTRDGKVKLESFRKYAQQKPCKYWETPAELGSVVSRSLIKLIKDKPAVGWVRGDAALDQNMLQEMVELRRKIELLEEENRRLKTQPPDGTEHLSQGEESFSLTYTYKQKDVSKNKKELLSSTFSATWDQIFFDISPLMITEAHESVIRDALKRIIKKSVSFDPLFIKINQPDIETMKIQFLALGLIKLSGSETDIKSSRSYWSLTPYGKNYMIKLRALKKN